jgi:hypothetical protein
MFTIDIKRTALAIIISVMAFVASAQTENVILKAMNDEMKRSMNELALPNHEKPFFISYSVTDAREVAINASLGRRAPRNCIPKPCKECSRNGR